MSWHWAEFELSDDHLEEAESGVEADSKAAAGAGTSGADRHLDSDGLEGKD